MVDASELPWRLLSRKYGTELAYTPMMNAGIFIREPRYRREHLESCAEDRPLIAQVSFIISVSSTTNSDIYLCLVLRQ